MTNAVSNFFESNNNLGIAQNNPIVTALEREALLTMAIACQQGSYRVVRAFARSVYIKNQCKRNQKVQSTNVSLVINS